jgi:hypothetical protein
MTTYAPVASTVPVTLNNERAQVLRIAEGLGWQRTVITLNRELLVRGDRETIIAFTDRGAYINAAVTYSSGRVSYADDRATLEFVLGDKDA